jgi:hypothetical protein
MSEKVNTMKSIALRAINTPAKALFGFFFSALSAAAVHAGTVQVSVVDRDGKPAQDAVVVLVHAIVRNAPTSLPTMATIANEKMQFIPAVTVVAKGAFREQRSMGSPCARRASYLAFCEYPRSLCRR